MAGVAGLTSILPYGTIRKFRHSPADSIGYEGKDYKLPAVSDSSFSTRVHDELDGIKYGLRPDPFGWIVRM